MRSRVAAGAAALLAAGVLALYLAVLRGEGDDPPLWVLALLTLGIASALVTTVTGRRAGALVGVAALGPLSLVALLSIGLLLVPSVLLLVVSCAAGRQPSR